MENFGHADSIANGHAQSYGRVPGKSGATSAAVSNLYFLAATCGCLGSTAQGHFVRGYHDDTVSKQRVQMAVQAGGHFGFCHGVIANGHGTRKGSLSGACGRPRVRPGSRVEKPLGRSTAAYWPFPKTSTTARWGVLSAMGTGPGPCARYTCSAGWQNHHEGNGLRFEVYCTRSHCGAQVSFGCLLVCQAQTLAAGGNY